MFYGTVSGLISEVGEAPRGPPPVGAGARIVSEDDFIYWQDALEQVQAGRTENIKCPFCEEGVIAVTQEDRQTRLECRKCRHFIEGRFGGQYA